MGFVRWQEVTRDQLAELLPESVVVLPIGATEQHGHHLATGTDALLAESVAERAVRLAGESATREFLLAPVISYGVSDHHLPYGGTLSVSPETMLALLLDMARSIAAQGGQRMVFVNGHGGNMGVCQAAAATAATRHGVAVGYFDYWALFSETAATGDERAEDGPAAFPGHAGQFETSLMLAIRPELVTEAKSRQVPAPITIANGQLHSERVWSSMDGFTDQPSDATVESGQKWFSRIVDALADRLVEAARLL